MSLETFGNEKSMNLDNILLTNIQSSLYFKNLYAKKSYHEVLDEIKRNVEILSPYIPNTKTPSTAFCLLYKFFLMKLTEKQMVGLLGNKESPYVRAVGALYLRYCTPPANLWDWFVEYLDDYDTIQISKSNEITVQKFLLDLLKENKFSGTVLPRIPTKIHQDILSKIKDYEKENGIVDNSNSSNGKYSNSKNNNGSSSRDNYRDGGRDRDGRDGGRDGRDGGRDRDSGRDRDRDNYRDGGRDRDNYCRDSGRDRDNYSSKRNNSRYSDDSDDGGKSKDPYKDELERYKNERSRYNSDSGSSRDRYNDRDDRYSRDRYNDRDDRYNSSSGGSRRDDYDSKKRSRSRSGSRDRYRNNNSSSSTTTTSTTSTTNNNIEKPKEESDNLKKLRSLYGASSDKVNLDD